MITFLSVLLTLSIVYNILATIAVSGPGEERPVLSISNKESSPICVCRHSISFHREGKTCKSQTFFIDGVKIEKSICCPCTKYIGPEPLPEYYHPALGA